MAKAMAIVSDSDLFVVVATAQQDHHLYCRL